jgi:hypothetical protein
MKPSPSYTGPILTSLAALFAASGACVYAVNIQKIFGGMHREREREFLSSFCVSVFYPLHPSVSRSVFRFETLAFTYHVFLLQTFYSRREQQRSIRRLDSIHDYKHGMARRDASFVSKWGGKRRSTWETNSTESDEKKHLSLNKLELRKCSREKEREKEGKKKKERGTVLESETYIT